MTVAGRHAMGRRPAAVLIAGADADAGADGVAGPVRRAQARGRGGAARAAGARLTILGLANVFDYERGPGLARNAAAPPGGVLNVGSGIALPTGRLALWVLEGYGRGELVIEVPREHDAFVLDVTRLMSRCTARPAPSTTCATRAWRSAGASPRRCGADSGREAQHAQPMSRPVSPVCPSRRSVCASISGAPGPR